MSQILKTRASPLRKQAAETAFVTFHFPETEEVKTHPGNDSGQSGFE